MQILVILGALLAAASASFFSESPGYPYGQYSAGAQYPQYSQGSLFSPGSQYPQYSQGSQYPQYSQYSQGSQYPQYSQYSQGSQSLQSSHYSSGSYGPLKGTAELQKQGNSFTLTFSPSTDADSYGSGGSYVKNSQLYR